MHLTILFLESVDIVLDLDLRLEYILRWLFTHEFDSTTDKV